MKRMRVGTQRLAMFVAVLAASVLVVPALAVDPSASGSAPAAGPSGSARPDRSPKPEKAEKVDVTITGTVGQATDGDGNSEYTLTTAGKTYRLDAGPAWWWVDANPLKPFVGRSVTIVGEGREGSNEIDVQSVDGAAIRPKGKPPWAGGWKRVGPKHPGWSAEKAAREAAKGPHGRDFAPGQLKKHANEEPEASEQPR